MLSKPLRSVKLVDIQGFADHLNESGLKPSSVHRAMSAVKSLFAFGFRLGYLQFDVGRAIRIPSFRDELAERILSEAEVLRIISLEPNPRNRAILLTLYAGGFRVSEICSLKWRHLQERDEAGQITGLRERRQDPDRPDATKCLGGFTQLCNRMLLPTPPSSAAGRKAIWTNPRYGGSSRKPPNGLASTRTCPATGFATPMPPMRWTEVVQFTLFRPRWAIVAWRQRGSICTPVLPIRAATICRSDFGPHPHLLERILQTGSGSMIEHAGATVNAKCLHVGVLPITST